MKGVLYARPYRGKRLLLRGRTDLPTGSMAKLMDSVIGTLFALPDETEVYPGHGEDTTIGYEKKHNMVAYYAR